MLTISLLSSIQLSSVSVDNILVEIIVVLSVVVCGVLLAGRKPMWMPFIAPTGICCRDEAVLKLQQDWKAARRWKDARPDEISPWQGTSASEGGLCCVCVWVCNAYMCIVMYVVSACIFRWSTNTTTCTRPTKWLMEVLPLVVNMSWCSCSCRCNWCSHCNCCSCNYNFVIFSLLFL